MCGVMPAIAPVLEGILGNREHAETHEAASIHPSVKSSATDATDEAFSK